VFIYSFFQSQHSSVVGKQDVRDAWICNNQKLLRKHWVYLFFWERQTATLYFYQDRYNYCSSVCTVLLEFLLKIIIGGRRKDGLSPKARRTWKNPLTYHCMKGIHCPRDLHKLTSHCFEPNLVREKEKNSGPWKLNITLQKSGLNLTRTFSCHYHSQMF